MSEDSGHFLDLDSSSQAPVRLDYLRARRMYRLGDYAGALQLFSQLAATSPDCTSILYPLACTHFQLRNYRDAVVVCNRLARLGDSRARLLKRRLALLRTQDPVAWEHSMMQPRSGDFFAPQLPRNSKTGAALTRLLVTGPADDVLALMRAAHLHHVDIEFVMAQAEACVPIQITSHLDRVLISAERGRGVLLSTFQVEGLCQYAGLNVGSYLVLCALLGATQWRALLLNPMLVAEDFRHGPPCNCLFAEQHNKQDFALLLETPQICSGCVDFYRCLGAEREIEMLLNYLDALGSNVFRQFDSSCPA